MHKYDVDIDGCINMQELAYCLEDAGLLEHLDVEAAGRYVEDMFVFADADKDGRIALPEFEMVLKMVQRDSSMGAKVRAPPPTPSHPLLPIRCPLATPRCPSSSNCDCAG